MGNISIRDCATEGVAWRHLKAKRYDKLLELCSTMCIRRALSFEFRVEFLGVLLIQNRLSEAIAETEDIQCCMSSGDMTSKKYPLFLEYGAYAYDLVYDKLSEIDGLHDETERHKNLSITYATRLCSQTDATDRAVGEYILGGLLKKHGGDPLIVKNCFATSFWLGGLVPALEAFVREISQTSPDGKQTDTE